ncbi:MAG: aminotransferase class V-fold PLP-dependent enzyme, partial [Bacteroidota bacterium]
MDRSRRKFFKTSSSLIGSLSLGQFTFAAKVPELARVQHATLEAAAEDEEFWQLVRQAYTSSGTMINLNNGGVSPQPRVVQDKQHLYTQFANESPGYYMWRVMGRERKQVRRQLAELAGCSAEEIAIVRNTTDALETVLQGIDWKAGDEVLTTDQDYPSLLHTLSMLEQRYGIQVRKISLPVPAEEEAEILQRFEEGISDRTRAMLFCHVINITGQILPAKSLCDLARKNGILSIVDGA